jgi:hypothetical protein
MSANIIGLIILGIAALVAIVILAVKHWDAIVETFKRAATWLFNMKELFLLMLGPMGVSIAAIINLATKWRELVAAFKEGGIIGLIKKIGEIIWDSIVAPIQQVIDLAKSIIPNAERREERRDRRDARRDARGDEPAQAAAVQQQRITEESRQRNDVFLHAPMGGGLSATPGGRPEPAVRLGAQ